MYPGIDEEGRETIFKTSSEFGGKINKYRAQQEFEHNINTEQKIKYTYTLMICHFMGC